MTSRERPFEPVTRKTFHASLIRELRKHIPTLGELTAEPLASHIEQMVEQFFPSPERMRTGQILWPGVDEKDRMAYGRRIEHTKIRPVLLDLAIREDLLDLMGGMSRKQIRQKVITRLFEQAYAQGALLTIADVAIMLHVDYVTIFTHIKEIDARRETPLPRRGTVQDFGPTITHKVQICRKVILEGHSIEQTARETRHSPEAITRYVNDYRRVKTCVDSGLSFEQTLYATRMSKRLVKEYLALVQEYTLHQPPPEEVEW
jgi:hypothetical protein